MLTFRVPSGPVEGEYDGVLLFTDLEADDALALTVLAPRLARVPTLAVVSEGDADKTELCCGYLHCVGLDAHASVVQGRRSSTPFPKAILDLYIPDAASSKAAVLKRPDSLPLECNNVELANERYAASQVEAFVEKCKAPLAIVLKPPDELVHISTASRAKITVAIYGSFNMTQMLGRHWSKGEEPMQVEFMRSFRATLWVERSVACGRDCSLHAALAPTLWTAAVEDQPTIQQHIRLWNKAIVKRSCRDIGMSEKEILQLMEAKDMSADEVARRVVAAGNNGKRVETRLNKIILPNVRVDCLQVCHADTLVVACLVDDDGKLGPHLLQATNPVRSEDGIRFKNVPGAGGLGRIAALVAEPGPPREACIEASIQALTAAISGRS
mmetsp:Transcript_20091/g.55166  ORF Transcript_20091/g.55166 Transcript_20091/m.55166 type:complete len:384 (-) Transcript_20091:194-1345(-)|eukprot:scaffold200022_cov40-Tisochrysis_lutea.AAC.1